jgi:hypothetical protein
VRCSLLFVVVALASEAAIFTTLIADSSFIIDKAIGGESAVVGDGGAQGGGRRLLEGWQIHVFGRLIGLVLACFISACTTVTYWKCYIAPTPDLYIPARAIVPQDLQGGWKHGIWDCTEALGTCLCFACCPTCAFAELWYRAGWIHAEMDDFRDNYGSDCDTSCPGWRFFVGVCGHCLLEEATAGCCLACAHTALRGGVKFIDGTDAGLPKTLKEIFGMGTYATFGEFFSDCCLYCWCAPCMATQEHRQVMELLKRGPVQQAAAPIPAVVGTPVQVMGAPMYQGTPNSGAPSVAKKQDVT